MTKARLLVLVAFAAGASCLYVAEKSVTLEGTLVSSACYLENDSHPTGNDMGGRKACGGECLKGGDPAGLVTKEKEFHILVTPSLALAPYVEQQVRLTGSDHNGTIGVEKAEVANSVIGRR
jgi:hypothetical protein